MENIIEVSALSHQFSRSEKSLDGISLTVKRGGIYGFLGPNGAGKTTTMRLMLGLLRLQSGQIRYFGQDFSSNRVPILRRVGSLIETPSMYGQLTATENLTVWQKIYQCPLSRIPEALRLVGLADTGRKKAGQFSLGMKQRLALATALLHEPEVLILDEPTNGLDPAGIIEMRDLLRQINREQGITILISSHLLSEVERLVSDVGIIHQGRMLFEGSLDSLMRRQKDGSNFIISTDQPLTAHAICQKIYPTAVLSDEKIVLPALTLSQVADLNRQLVQEGVGVYEMKTPPSDLESIFISLTHA